MSVLARIPWRRAYLGMTAVALVASIVTTWRRHAEAAAASPPVASPAAAPTAADLADLHPIDAVPKLPFDAAHPAAVAAPVAVAGEQVPSPEPEAAVVDDAGPPAWLVVGLDDGSAASIEGLMQVASTSADPLTTTHACMLLGQAGREAELATVLDRVPAATCAALIGLAECRTASAWQRIARALPTIAASERPAVGTALAMAMVGDRDLAVRLDVGDRRVIAAAAQVAVQADASYPEEFRHYILALPSANP